MNWILSVKRVLRLWYLHRTLTQGELDKMPTGLGAWFVLRHNTRVQKAEAEPARFSVRTVDLVYQPADNKRNGTRNLSSDILSISLRTPSHLFSAPQRSQGPAAVVPDTPKASATARIGRTICYNVPPFGIEWKIKIPKPACQPYYYRIISRTVAILADIVQ